MMNPILLALLFVSLFGCTRPLRNTVTVRTAAGRTLTFPLAGTLRISDNTPPLDWHARDSRMHDNVMEGLLQYDYSAGRAELRPALAESWRSHDGNRRWTFRLRRDVRWTDGVAFEARHVVDGWRRVLAPETASPVGYFLFGIRNARAFREGKVPFERVGVKISKAGDLEVELEKPLAFFPHLLTNSSTFPIRLDLIEKFGPAWNEVGNLATLGPYRAIEYGADRLLVLARNETYYDAKAIAQAPERVIVHHVSDEAPLRMFEAGELDVIPAVDLADERSIPVGPSFRRNPMLSLAYLGFGTKRKPFDDPRVRRAVARALDRVAAAKLVGRGQVPLASWTPPGTLGFEEKSGLTFDAKAARALLAEAGLASIKPPKIELAIYQGEDKEMAESIQYQLKQNLGWTVEITQQDWPTLKRRFDADPPSLFLTTWNLDFPDPDNVFNLLTSFSGNNHTQWTNAKFDDLVLRAAVAPDPARRRALYHEAQVLLLEREVPALPLYSRAQTTLVGPRVAAYPLSPLGKIKMKDIRLHPPDSGARR